MSSFHISASSTTNQPIQLAKVPRTQIFEGTGVLSVPLEPDTHVQHGSGCLQQKPLTHPHCFSHKIILKGAHHHSMLNSSKKITPPSNPNSTSYHFISVGHTPLNLIVKCHWTYTQILCIFLHNMSAINGAIIHHHSTTKGPQTLCTRICQISSMYHSLHRRSFYQSIHSLDIIALLSDNTSQITFKHSVTTAYPTRTYLVCCVLVRRSQNPHKTLIKPKLARETTRGITRMTSQLWRRCQKIVLISY